MECLKNGTILEFHPDTLQGVRNVFGLHEPGAMKEAVDVLDDWAKKQKHFTKRNFERDYLERIIIASKGSVERAKQRLDKVCTVRTLIPYMFEDVNVKTDFKDLYGSIYCALLPKLTAKHERIYLVKNVGYNFNTRILLHGYIFTAMVLEYNKKYDYSFSVHVVLDFRSASLAQVLSKLDIVDLRNAATVFIEGYGAKVGGVHLITDSKMVDTAVTIFKQIVPAKIGNRIYVHKNLESLYDHVDRDILPIEYGGKEESTEDLFDRWVEELSSKEYRDYQSEMNGARIDEILRNKDKFNEDYMGMPGSFRALSVD